MAIYNNGIKGPFSGKVGTVVGSSWNGITYMRSLPRKSNRPPTEKQKAQRMKMSLAISFLSPISGLINSGFPTEVPRKSGFNMATSYIIQEAVTGDYPDYSLDLSKVLISSGNLTGAWNVGLTSARPGEVTVTWSNNSGSGLARDTDEAIILIYNPARAEYIYTISGERRDMSGHTMGVPSLFSGDDVVVWIAFRSATRKSVSTSIYAGSIKVM